MCVAAHSRVNQASHQQHLFSVAEQVGLEKEDQFSLKEHALLARLKHAGAGNECYGMFDWLPPSLPMKEFSNCKCLFGYCSLLLVLTPTTGVDPNSAVLPQSSFFLQSLNLPLLVPHRPGLF